MIASALFFLSFIALAGTVQQGCWKPANFSLLCGNPGFGSFSSHLPPTVDNPGNGRFSGFFGLF
jgi:hypothetical protein